MALSTLANISSAEMARDCAPEVEKLLESQNLYIRKKALLATIRIIRKAPDLLEGFIPYVKKSMKQKNHNVLITATSLILEMCNINPSVIPSFRKMVTHLVRVYNDILQQGFSHDYDVNGINDPFLQVKLLRLLRVLGHNSAEASDTMNLLLANIATNTDSVKNVGNAILYECVNTIMGVESESGLRILAINTLGRFLSNRDNNIRYVALNTLCNVVNYDNEAVQRHRNTIVECLKDNDVSIRRRALELIYALVNQQNAHILVKELIAYLENADIQFRSDLTTKLCVVVEKYSPRPTFYVHTLIKIMKIAGNYVPQQFTWNLISFISRNPNLQTYATQKLYLALQSDISQQSLIEIASWCIGEYGDSLLQGPAQVSTNDEEEQVPKHFKTSEDEIIELFTNVLRSPSTLGTSKMFVVNALGKLTSRLKSGNVINAAKELLSEYSDHINVELQQRSVEYIQVLNSNLQDQLLAKLPPFEPKTMDTSGINNNVLNDIVVEETKQPSKQNVSLLDDLLDLGPSLSPTVPQQQVQTPITQNVDLLSSLFGPSPSPSQPTTQVSSNILTPSSPTIQPNNQSSDLLDLLGSDTITIQPQQIQTSPTIPIHQQPSQPTEFAPFVAFQNEDVIVQFHCVKPQPQNPQNTIITAHFINNNANSLPLNNFEMKVSVQKFIKFQLGQATGNVVSKGSNVTQQIKLSNTMHGSKPISMKIRITYIIDNQPRQYDKLIDNFPQGL